MFTTFVTRAIQICTLALSGLCVFAQSPNVPSITGFANNYSFIAAGLPNFAIAQGSIFVIFGIRLSPTSTGLQTAPLPTSLNGVSVLVSAAGVARQASLYYVTPTQIAAIMPSSIPSGTVTVTVTRDGSNMASSMTEVRASAFGILTLNNGTGPAAAYDSTNNLLTASNAANPGDTIVLWGTGAGPVPNDAQQSPVNTPLSVLIGGLPARIMYQGRSQYPGLDQLNVVVPAGISGCYVSVVVQTGLIVSNYSSIPVATSGRMCSDSALGTGLSSTQLQALAGKTILNTAVLLVGKSVNLSTNDSVDIAIATFQRSALPGRYDAYVAPDARNDIASVGNCSVAPGARAGSSTSLWPLSTISSSVALNAGPGISLSGPGGSQSMPYENGGYAASGQLVPNAGGVFAFDNFSGGPDVKPFRVTLRLNSVGWTNSLGLTTINRAQGVTVTWSGGSEGDLVDVSGYSAVAGGSIFATFACKVAATAHQFTVPASVLMSLPPGGDATLSVGSSSAPVSIPLSEFDLAYAAAYVNYRLTTVYK